MRTPIPTVGSILINYTLDSASALIVYIDGEVFPVNLAIAPFGVISCTGSDTAYSKSSVIGASYWCESIRKKSSTDTYSLMFKGEMCLSLVACVKHRGDCTFEVREYDGGIFIDVTRQGTVEVLRVTDEEEVGLGEPAAYIDLVRTEGADSGTIPFSCSLERYHALMESKHNIQLQSLSHDEAHVTYRYSTAEELSTFTTLYATLFE